MRVRVADRSADAVAVGLSVSENVQNFDVVAVPVAAGEVVGDCVVDAVHDRGEVGDPEIDSVAERDDVWEPRVLERDLSCVSEEEPSTVDEVEWLDERANAVLDSVMLLGDCVIEFIARVALDECVCVGEGS